MGRFSFPSLLKNDNISKNWSIFMKRFSGNKFYLDVPFKDKDEAKYLGAMWDKSERSWFILSKMDFAKFSKWLPTDGSIDMIASHYFIAERTRECPDCGGISKITAFLMPPSCFALKEIGEWGDPGWATENWAYWANYIEYLDQRSLDEMQAINPSFQKNESQTAEKTYFMNHCSKCGSKFGDWFLFLRPGQGFFFHSYDEFLECKITRFDNMFVARSGGTSCSIASLGFFKVALD